MAALTCFTQDLDPVSALDFPTREHLREDTFGRHDALTDEPPDFAVGMTRLADLGHLQERAVSNPYSSPKRKDMKDKS
jgi:hypothetical protein